MHIENNRAALLAAGALQVLVDILKCTDSEMPETTQRYAAVAICDLIQGSGKYYKVDSCTQSRVALQTNVCTWYFQRYGETPCHRLGNIRRDQAYSDFGSSTKQ